MLASKLISSNSFTNKIIVLFFGVFIFSCKQPEQSVGYMGIWMEVKKSGNTFRRIDCGYAGETITVTSDSLYHNGVMEDLSFKVDHIKQAGNKTTFFVNKEELSFYRFSWVDQDLGIAKWETSINGELMSRYFVNQLNKNKINIVKGTETDCITSEDQGDQFHEFLPIGDGTKTLYVEDDNCISIKNYNAEQLYERCFEGVTIRIRNLKGNFLPLTLISGKKSIDVEFSPADDDWVTKALTLYDGETKDGQKILLPSTLSIRDFDFDRIISQFDNQNNKLNGTIKDLEDTVKLKDIDVYGIADILNSTPVNQNNLPVYREASLELIDLEMYNEARIILLDLVKNYPADKELFLNLGDAQWGFDDQSGAKESYQTYLTLLKREGKSPQEAPKRVTERVR
jgi:hypothetical protein